LFGQSTARSCWSSVIFVFERIRKFWSQSQWTLSLCIFIICIWMFICPFVNMSEMHALPFKGHFPLGGIFRAERNFSLSCDHSGGTN
jgi:hypothetical protein